MIRSTALTRPGARGLKKLRFAPRRLRTLQRWSDGFAGFFPDEAELAEDRRYWNYKIPVHSCMVEAPSANPVLQRECAQRMIDACHHLIQARPASASTYRITCCIVLPYMFASELCIYLDEAYFREHTASAMDASGSITVLKGESLAAMWGLTVPPGMQEHGVQIVYSETDVDDGLDVTHWYYGDVAGID